MKTFVYPSLLQCMLGVALCATCSVMLAQAPAAPTPASGGAPRSGAATNRPNTGAAANRTDTGAAANRNTTAAPATPGTNTGTTTSTNPNGTTATGTNAARTNATGTTATGTAGTNATGTNATGTNTTGTANQSGVNSTAGTNSMPPGTLTSSGMIANFGANDFALQGATTTSPNAAPSDFLIGSGTVFEDSFGNAVPRERFFRRGSNVPATVYYTRSPNGSLLASKVVLNANESAPTTSIESAGTITEVSPGILVIEQPGASDTPVRYVNNKTTNYVNENGEPVPPESVKAGTPVKIFYTKVGDTLVASKVEVHRNNNGGLPKPVVPAEQSSTRPAKK
jgi:hypothetical protein